jgi:hypothetical protein
MDSGMSLSDIAAVTRNDNGWGNDGGWFMWVFALLLLPGLFGGGMWGNRGQGEPVSESALCNSMNFNNLENAVGRLGDQLNNAYMGLQNGMSQMGYATLQNFGQTQRDMCTGFSAVTAAVNAAAAQAQQCCCDTEKAILENRYLAERNTAATNAVTVEQTQKILDAICGNRMADMQNQINNLQLQTALSGVVRYPMATTYATTCNPFFGGCACGNNI